MYSKQIEELQKDILSTISGLAREFQRLIENSAVNKEEHLRGSAQKLELDIHTMTLDQKSRHLLEIIRRLKELKIVTNSYQEERSQFEGECFAASDSINKCLSESYAELLKLSDDSVSMLHESYKLLN